MISCFQNKEL